MCPTLTWLAFVGSVRASGMEAVAVYRPAPVLAAPAGVDPAAFSAYGTMARDSGGRVVSVGDASEVPDALRTLLASHAGAEAVDVAVVIDVTGSMSDDIVELRSSVGDIVATWLRADGRHRIGVVSYGDRGDRVISRVVEPLTGSRPAIEAAMRRLELCDGGDFPEHAYHGLQRAIDELSWGAGAKRVAILIGDAPPHEDYDDPSPAAIAAKVANARVQVSTLLIGR